MGKQGPCYHCGITTTPLWRNGPPDKPVLCNACGSRWRTKGTLLNYMPMHSGGFGVGTENARWPMKNTSSRPGSGGVYVAARPPDHKTSRKRKEFTTSDGNSESGLSKTSTYLSSSIDEEDASTMASEISTFDGPLSNLASAVPGRGLAPWDTPVPSRRRTNMFRSRASSEKMSRKLQVSADEQEVSSVTCPSSDILLETNRSPLVAVEIGLGSVFIRPPAHLLSQQQQQQQQLQLQQQQHQQQQESEASSLLIDSNTSRATAYEHTEVFSNSEGLLSSGNRLAVARGKDKLRPALKRPEAGYNPNKTLLESFPYNKRDVLQSVQSPLVFLELKDIVNLDTFSGLLTEQEQLQLMKYLSSVDASQFPDSLRSLFSSSQFEGALSNFQRLLSEGMFDSSDVGFNPRVLQHYQQLLSVTDLTASGWTESLSQLQSRNKRRGPEPCVRDKEVELLSSAERTVEPYKAGSSSAVNDSSAKAKKAVNLMEEGHDSGGEQEDLLVEVPSFHKADSLLLLDHNKQQQGGAWPSTNPQANVYEKDRASNINIHNNNSNVCGGAEVGDLIVTNTWQTADWDGGLIWNNVVRGRRDVGNGTMLRP